MKFSNHSRMAALLPSMAFPNRFALYASSGKVKSGLNAFPASLGSGEPGREVGFG